MNITKTMSWIATAGLAAGLGASTASANIIVNGDFESGGFASTSTSSITPGSNAGQGWYSDAPREWAGNTSSPIEGTRDAASAGNGREKNFGQIVTEDSSGDLQFSFDWEFVNASGRDNLFGVEYWVYTTDNGSASLNTDENATPGGSGWTQQLFGSVSEDFDVSGSSETRNGSVTETVTLPGQTYVAVALRSISTGLSGDYSSTNDLWRVDNVSLVPEPASLALMGLGGLVMFGGRRRR